MRFLRWDNTLFLVLLLLLLLLLWSLLFSIGLVAGESSPTTGPKPDPKQINYLCSQLYAACAQNPDSATAEGRPTIPLANAAQWKQREDSDDGDGELLLLVEVAAASTGQLLQSALEGQWLSSDRVLAVFVVLGLDAARTIPRD